MMVKINLLGIPFDANSSFLRGASQGPNAIREIASCGSANDFCERGFDLNLKLIKDHGNINFKSDDAKEAFNEIYKSVKVLLKKDETLISLGGDHSIAYPIIKAHADYFGPINILQIDAHGDLYEDFEGNYFSHASPFARLFEDGCIASLTQIGIRSLNTHQREQIKKYNVNSIEMKDHQDDFIENLDGPLYISFDLDGIDPAFAPGVSHHEPGGFSSRQVIDIIHSIKVPIIGADIVELNPNRDWQNMTTMLAYKIMKEIMSKMLY
jgi:agmatinase